MGNPRVELMAGLAVEAIEGETPVHPVPVGEEQHRLVRWHVAAWLHENGADLAALSAASGLPLAELEAVMLVSHASGCGTHKGHCERSQTDCTPCGLHVPHCRHKAVGTPIIDVWAALRLFFKDHDQKAADFRLDNPHGIHQFHQ